jgi:hypothetical protein
LQWKILAYFMTLWSRYFTAIGNIFGHLVYFVVIWYIFPRFGILYLEKSGNPAGDANLAKNFQHLQSWQPKQCDRKLL